MKISFNIKDKVKDAHGETITRIDGKDLINIKVGYDDYQLKISEDIEKANDIEIIVSLAATNDVAEATNTVTHEITIHVLPTLRFIQMVLERGAVAGSTIYPRGEGHLDHQRFVTGEMIEWGKTLELLLDPRYKDVNQTEMLLKFKGDWEGGEIGG